MSENITKITWLTQEAVVVLMYKSFASNFWGKTISVLLFYAYEGFMVLWRGVDFE